MKNKKILGLITWITLLCFFLTGCPRPKSTTTTIECTRNGNGTVTCSVKVVLVTLAENANQFTSQLNSTEGIFDLTNPWQPDLTQNASLNLKYLNADGFVVSQQNFPLILSTNNSNPVTPVDVDTTPYLYVLQNPDDVTNFMNQSFAANGNITDVQVNLNLPFKKRSGTFAPGDYSNHLRWRDSNGVTYVGDFITTIEQTGSGCTPRTSC